ncbi:MAG: J domain-containing protein [Alphaproteobacteria bacterium]
MLEAVRRSRPSYAVACSSAFRDAILGLAARRGATPGEILRSVMLLVPPAVIEGWPDPGEPAAGDREAVLPKSGNGRPWRRKPRLQVRLAEGHAPATIRRALAVALAMADGALTMTLEAGDGPRMADRLAAAEAGRDRLLGVVQALAFRPLAEGVRSRADALHVLGYAPGAIPDESGLRQRFRSLAAIFHPDAPTGDHRRMSQLNQAVALLRVR